MGVGLLRLCPKQNILGPATMRRLVFFQPLFRRTIANREEAAEADSVVRAVAIVAMRKSVSVDVHKALCGRGGVTQHSIAVAVMTTAFCARLCVVRRLKAVAPYLWDDHSVAGRRSVEVPEEQLVEALTGKSHPMTGQCWRCNWSDCGCFMSKSQS